MHTRRQSKPQDAQQTLDFTSRMNEIIAACRSLERVECGLGPERMAGVIELLVRIALMAKDSGGLVSFARVSTLAARLADRKPVSERTIRRWRRDAQALGVLEVLERSHQYGGHHTNRWAIQLVRIRELLRAGVGPDVGRTRGGHDVRPGADTVSALTVVRTCITNQEQEPVPVPEGPDTETEDGKTSGGSWNDYHASGSPGPDAKRRSERGAVNSPPDQASEREAALLAQHPLLREARTRRIEPLPRGRLCDGNAFAPLELGDLRTPWRMVLWFRCQLSLQDPLLAGTEAHLLLLLAAAWHSVTCPESDVRRSRAALFAYTVSRRRWNAVVMRCLPNARAQLDELLRYLPEAYTARDSLGPKRVELSAQEVLH